MKIFEMEEQTDIILMPHEVKSVEKQEDGSVKIVLTPEGMNNFQGILTEDD